MIMSGTGYGTAYYIGDEEISREEYCAYIRQLLNAPDGDDIPIELRILWSNEHLSDIIE